jgi:15-cis-phytoene synthase/lycopene beta-cyclase
MPIAVILFLIYYPMFTLKDKMKFVCLTMFTLVYTIPWINYLAYHDIWMYDSLHVLFTVGYIPVEEYFFLLIQIVITIYLHLMMSKLTLSIVHIGKFGQSALEIFFASYFVPSISFCLACLAWQMVIPDCRTFYMVSKTINIF